MKTSIILFAAIVMMAGFTTKIIAQTYDYSVNWNDTSTYKVTCGKVVSAQWSVKNDTCEMTTPHLRAEAVAGCHVSFNFWINQSGNGEPADKCYAYYQIDNGAWVLDTVFVAGGSPAVHPISESVYIDYEHFVQFKIRMATNSNTEFWAILDGNMGASDGDITESNLSLWSGEPPPPPTLPVELLMFNGMLVNGAVELNWATASETNNNYFTIERSNDGMTFEEIGFIQGAGNSNNISEYKFSDYVPIEVAYYRLKQTDFDGKSEYVGATFYSLYNIDVFDEKPLISVTSENIVQVSIISDENHYAHIGIYDISGKIIKSNNVEIIKGGNIYYINASVQNPGIYILALVTDENTWSGKITLN